MSRAFGATDGANTAAGTAAGAVSGSGAEHGDEAVSPRLLRKIALLEHAAPPVSDLVPAAAPPGARTGGNSGGSSDRRMSSGSSGRISAVFPQRKRGRPPAAAKRPGAPLPPPSARAMAVVTDAPDDGLTARERGKLERLLRLEAEQRAQVRRALERHRTPATVSAAGWAAAVKSSHQIPAEARGPGSGGSGSGGGGGGGGDNSDASPDCTDGSTMPHTCSSPRMSFDFLLHPAPLAGGAPAARAVSAVDSPLSPTSSAHDGAPAFAIPTKYGAGKLVRVREPDDSWHPAHIVKMDVQRARLLVHFVDSTHAPDRWVQYDPLRVKRIYIKGNNIAAQLARQAQESRLALEPTPAPLTPAPSVSPPPPALPAPAPLSAPSQQSDFRQFLTRRLLRELEGDPRASQGGSGKTAHRLHPHMLDTSDDDQDNDEDDRERRPPARQRHPARARLVADGADASTAEDDDGEDDGGLDDGSDEDGSDSDSDSDRSDYSHDSARRRRSHASAAARHTSERRGHRGRLSAKEQRRLQHQQRRLAELELRKRQQAELDASAWFRCDNCQHGIHHVRYSCQYCETREDSLNTYDLCTACFQLNFPLSHPHPRESFALEAIREDLWTEDASAAGKVLKPDRFLPEWETLRQPQSEFEMLLSRKDLVCELCDEAEGPEYGPFVSSVPFALTHPRGPVSYFWIHRACALASPEVLCRDAGSWFNVASAVRRGKRIKCTGCGKKGATIGCLDIRCNKSFHVRCCGRAPESFERGVLYWCAQHDETRTSETYKYLINCDGCQKLLQDSWRSCEQCESYWNGFDLCHECFERLETDAPPAKQARVEHTLTPEASPVLERVGSDAMHEAEREPSTATAAPSSPPVQREPLYHMHGRECFKTTDENAFVSDAANGAQDPKHTAKARPRRHRSEQQAAVSTQCFYCSTTDSTEWRRGFHGVIMCGRCASESMVDQLAGQDDLAQEDMFDALGEDRTEYTAAVEDYAHQPYLTRRVFSSTRTDESAAAVARSQRPLYLPSYAPAADQLYSLGLPTTFFDVPGRAPRWASHSSSDYSGTWLPQIVRWALQRFTDEGDRVLSNFLGRGTDVIEAFLLGRKAVGVDINAMAVALSQRNCTFAVPPELQAVMRADRRPTLIMANALKLQGHLFRAASFDHVLSHPPYFRCIVYSAHLDEDLSRSPDLQTFAQQIGHVACETRRVLKPGKRCTLGIGDNREHCFVIPVSFVTVRAYMEAGFALEELIVKRQRCCSGTAKGASLSMLHDFLIITHEFIAVLRNPDPLVELDACLCRTAPLQALAERRVVDVSLLPTECARDVVPPSSFSAQCKVLGTVWCFPTTTTRDLVDRTCAQVVGRFASPGQRWNHVRWLTEPSAMEPVAPVSGEAPAAEDVPIETELPAQEEGEGLSAYEVEKNRRVQSNNRLLQVLGLLSTDESMAGASAAALRDLDEDLQGIMRRLARERSDLIELDAAAPEPGAAPLAAIASQPAVNLVFIDPLTVTSLREVEQWRGTVLARSTEAARSLCLGGVLAVGARDRRFPCETCKCITLWPLGLLIWSDLEGPLRALGLALKEIVAVAPQRFSKTKSDAFVPTEPQAQRAAHEIEHLPIVHDLLLIFVKRAPAGAPGE